MFQITNQTTPIFMEGYRYLTEDLDNIPLPLIHPVDKCMWVNGNEEYITAPTIPIPSKCIEFNKHYLLQPSQWS